MTGRDDLGSRPTAAATGTGSGGARSGEAEALDRGQAVGRFLVLDRLGAGGMGVVYAAYDPELDRKVALKFLLGRSSSGGPASQERLHREAQAMARLSHPNVVGVYDVGTFDERVYVSMELVEGRTLSRWLEETTRPWREIVAMFVQAGRGLAAAHAQQLVHRDFKPDNVMVDSTGRARVMDFGLARTSASLSPSVEDVPLDGAPTEGSHPRLAALAAKLTAAGATMGTPAYMAPEQFHARDADARSDQFSFCVSLWESLHGEHPFSGEGLPALMRAVIEGNRRRPTGRHSLPRTLRRALDRGLSVDPDERYPSMAALLDDLSVGPHRRLGAVFGAGGLVTALGVGALALWRSNGAPCTGAAAALQEVWSAQRRARVHDVILASAAPFADRTWETVGPALDAWAEEWIASHTHACEATQRGEQSETALDLRMSCLHRTRFDLDAAVTVLESGTHQSVEHGFELVSRLPALEQCSDVAALSAGTRPPDPNEASAVGGVRAELAMERALRYTGHYPSALEAALRAQAASSDLSYQPVRAEVLVAVGTSYGVNARHQQAEDALREAQELAGRLRDWDLVRDATIELMVVLGHGQDRYAEALALEDLAKGLVQDNPEVRARLELIVGVALTGLGRLVEAEAKYRSALAIRTEIMPPNHPDVAASHGSVGAVLVEQGKYDEAEVAYRTAVELATASLGPDHPSVATPRHNLGTVLFEQGRYDEAEVEIRAAMSIRMRALGEGHRDVARTRGSLARLLVVRGDYAGAESQYRAAMEVSITSLGANHAQVSELRNGLAASLGMQGRNEESAEQFRRTLAARRARFGDTHPLTVQTRNNLAILWSTLGRHEDAVAEHRAVLAAQLTTLGAQHPKVAHTRESLGVALSRLGHHDEARQELEIALAVRIAATSPDHPGVSPIRSSLARVLQAQGAMAEAEQEYRTALRIAAHAHDEDHPTVALAELRFGEFLAAVERPREAAPLLEHAWAVFQVEGGKAEHAATAAFALAQVLATDPATRARAVALARTASTVLDQPSGALRGEIDAWLREHDPDSGR